LKKVFVLLGPTASGKTALSLYLANELNAEIISADSRQVYKHIQIATCAPTADELSKAKHYFVNELEIDEDFNAGTFARKSKDIILDIFKRGKNALIVGGSGLYIKSLIDGFFEEGIKDLNIRKELNDKLHTEGRESLYRLLMSIDPDTAIKMDAGKFRRVIRALEVYYATGRKMSELQENTIKPDFDSVQVGLTFERDVLYDRINDRVNELIENGLIEEINSLREKGYSPQTHNSLNTVGVKEVFKYLNNEITKEDMISMIKQNTRRYAKRQMTWFNADRRIHWVKPDDYDNLELCSKHIADIFNER
jgi:tRNA dimethylallyltransferase